MGTDLCERLLSRHDATVLDAVAVNVIRHLEAQVAQFKSATEWRPIGDAPRDGTHILAASCVAPYQPPTAVHWHEDGFYLSVNRNGDDAGHGCSQLTHWRPLDMFPSSYVVAEPFDCPIGEPGCTKNCGSYGCGN